MITGGGGVFARFVEQFRFGGDGGEGDGKAIGGGPGGVEQNPNMVVPVQSGNGTGRMDKEFGRLRRKGGVIMDTGSGATMIPSDCDWDAAMEPLQEEMPAEKILKLMIEREEEPWFSTDVAALLRSWNEPSKHKLGATACKYLDSWERTCGGRKMMETGMWTYWKDPVESPRKLRAEKRMQEHQMNAEEKEAFRRLLDEDLLQEVVHRISFQQSGYVSPAHVVAKKPGKDGKKKWRLVVNNIRVNAEQVTLQDGRSTHTTAGGVTRRLDNIDRFEECFQ
jgi:hypothetical protein